MERYTELAIKKFLICVQKRSPRVRAQVVIKYHSSKVTLTKEKKINKIGHK